MAYADDPGGHFASDAHRRVMAHLPNPDDDPLDVETLIVNRINRDQHALAHFEAASEVVDVLRDLEAVGYATELKDGWKNTKEGFELLTGPPAETVATAGAAVIGLDVGSLNHEGGS